MSGYSVSPQTVEDLFEIRQYIARDKESVTDRVQSEFCETFSVLAACPARDIAARTLR
jgi:hypothetical protein